MKDSKVYSKKVAAFIKKQGKKTTLSLPESNSKTDILVYAGLSEHLPTEKIGQFWDVMQEHFVDWNDLRVSRSEEVLDVVSGIEVALDVKKRLTNQLIAALNGVFTKYDRITLEELDEIGKREAGQQLESIEELTPFMVNFIMLVVKGSHSLPVNEKMAVYAIENSLVHPKSELKEIQSFLQKQISVDDTAVFYLVLREQAENFEPPTKPAEKAAKKAKKAVKKTAAKKTAATKKATSKKTTAKKAAAKKTTAKKTAQKKTAVKKTAAKKSTAKKTAPKKTAAKKTTAKKTTAKKTSPKKKAAVKKKTAPKKTAAKKTAKTKTAVKKTTAKKKK